jgi:hypothetical protein
MAHQITSVTKKNNDWIVVSILNAAGEIVENVSVNRTNKKGEVFPGFDDIAVGNQVAGQLWRSPKGAMYLFAPKGSATTTMDRGPAARNPETAEIKNLITLKLVPMLDVIRKDQIAILGKLGMAESDDDFQMPTF